MNIISSTHQVSKMQQVLNNYLKLPFSEATVPGTIMEHTLAFVRNAEVLNTYDFVDVIDRQTNLGWQVKSTKNTTPITWKRAKLTNSLQLIQESFVSKCALQNLGDTIIDFCNSHALESMNKYNLNSIGYSRLIVFPKKIIYFEKELCSSNNPEIFQKNQYNWKWSTPKKTR